MQCLFVCISRGKLENICFNCDCNVCTRADHAVALQNVSRAMVIFLTVVILAVRFVPNKSVYMDH